jgi:hypothetical protein
VVVLPGVVPPVGGVVVMPPVPVFGTPGAPPPCWGGELTVPLEQLARAESPTTLANIHTAEKRATIMGHLRVAGRTRAHTALVKTLGLEP